MKNEDREKIALWRFGFIAPAYNDSHGCGSNAAYFRTLEGKDLKDPVTSQVHRYCKGTFENWLSRYKRFGFDGLMPGERSDAGTSRALSQAAQEYIADQIERYPRILNTIIRRRLIENGIVDGKISQSTVDRFVKNYRSSLPQKDEYHEGKDRKAFEFEYANQCWQADTTYLEKLDGHQTYLINIIDDASRMIVGFEVFFADSAVNFQKVLKDAVMTYGIPSILYVDNGSPYANHQLGIICAKLGIELINTPVRDGSAKGKVEIWHKTLKNHLFRCNDWNRYHTLDDINNDISRYLSDEYNVVNHGSSERDAEGNLLNARERYFRDADRFVFRSDEDLDMIFLHNYKRKVRSDATIRYNNVFYETTMDHIGETVTLVINPFDVNKAWIRTADDDGLIPVSLLNRKENRKVQRRQHMKIRGDENER